MRQIRLTRQEKDIEGALVRGEYRNIPESEFEEIARAVAHRRKDATLTIRVNSQDLREIRRKAQRLGVRYQTFIAELLHQVAHD